MTERKIYKLNFIQDLTERAGGAEKKILLRTLIQEITSQIPLRNCSKEVGVEASIHEINPRKILKTEGLRE